MDSLGADHSAMQIANPVTRQHIDSNGMRCITRLNGEVSYDMRPRHLIQFEIFNRNDTPGITVDDILNGTYDNDVDIDIDFGLYSSSVLASSSFHRMISGRMNYNLPGRAPMMSYSQPPPPRITPPVLTGCAPMMGYPQRAPQRSTLPASMGPAPVSSDRPAPQLFRHAARTNPGLMMLYPQHAPQFLARPLLTNVAPMMPHRQPEPQLSTLPVPTGPARVVSNVQPPPELFTVPYRQPAPQLPAGPVRQRTRTKRLLFPKLPYEIQAMILKYAFKASHLFRLNYNGQIDSNSAYMQSLLGTSHRTDKDHPGLLYRQNVFVCPFPSSLTRLLRHPIEITTHILHINLPINILAQARMPELRKLPNLKTVHIDAVAGYRSGFRPKITTKETVPRRQGIQLAVLNMLNSPAMRSRGPARFDTSKRAVRDLMNTKKVEVTFAAEYSVNTYRPYKRWEFETVFKIKLVDGGVGYELEMKSDELVRSG